MDSLDVWDSHTSVKMVVLRLVLLTGGNPKMDLKMGLHTNFDYLPTLLGTHISISPTKVLLRMIFLFSSGHMLVPRRVNQWTSTS